MNRIPFSQMIKKAGADIRREYDRLFALFYKQKISYYGSVDITLREFCANSFSKFPFRETCISLKDFDDSNGFNFKEEPVFFDLNYLVLFCEYSYSLIDSSTIYNYTAITPELNTAMQLYIRQLNMVIEAIGYMKNKHKGITDLVPKDQAAISVAEILIDPNLSYRVIEYNHHSMKGDLERKKATLVALGDKLEPLRDKLEKANEPLKKDIFCLLNNMNLRHNNTDPGSNYRPYVASMKKEELEQWYDDLYQMILLAFLELDHLDRKGRIDRLEDNLSKK